jgi:hypothetical protein
MYICRFPYKRRSLQRPASLTQLLAYLLNPKQETAGPNHKVRLAGPPWGARVIQRASPFGDSAQVKVAARDLAQQFFDHIHQGVKDRQRPYRVYLHMAIGFPLDFEPRAPVRPVGAFKNSPASIYFFWLAAVREVLGALGVNEHLPHLIVMHNDREHLHAHVVVALFARGIDAIDIYRRMTKPRMKTVAATFYPAQGWPAPSEALRDAYEKALKRTYGGQ